MTPGQRRFGRRALIVGGTAAVAFEALRLWDNEGVSAPGATTEPGPEQAYNGSEQTVDLTVRWRHLERRVETATLLAAWHFDEGTGYAFDDVSGNGHPLSITGSSWNTTDSGLAGAIHRSGLRGGAVYLNGTRWLAADLTSDLTVPAGLSFSCWLRVTTLPRETALLVGLGSTASLVLDAAGSLTLTVTDDNAVPHVVRTAGGALTPGGWTQVTATADPASGAVRLYLHGSPVAGITTSPFTMATGGAWLVLGQRFTGALDEATIHGVALTAGEVRRLYVVGLPTVYTQTSESIDTAREVFTRFKGSEPIPHPALGSTLLTARFADSSRTDQGRLPGALPPATDFVPGAFGGAWRAMSDRLSYRSPLTGASGTFEAWYRTVADPSDPTRQRRKELFSAVGAACSLTLYTEAGRWTLEVRRPGGRVDTKSAPAQVLTPLILEHVGVTWGRQPSGVYGVVLYVNGVPEATLTTSPSDTTYSGTLSLGGTRAAPTYCLIDDIRVSDIALAWGDICPRGQATTDAAGLDLRDAFDRPPGSSPMLWRAGSSGGEWSHRRKTWEKPGQVGDDPDSLRALFQGSPTGLNPIYHPDAFGHSSSIEAGVAFPVAVDGWAGLFVQSPQPEGSFSGVTFMLNPHLGQLRLARFDGGLISQQKLLPYDFPTGARTTYELTLTSAGDGIVRGFVDGTNVISMRVATGWPTQGFAGMLTENAQAFFSNLHYCALTPATAASRVIRTRVQRYGAGAAVGALELVPFRWHKRRGLLPWQYVSKNPEPAGNIAGAATTLPLRPIPPAAWRSGDSANSDLITVNGRVLYFMRGNQQVAHQPSVARIGVLHSEVAAFDAIHFTDPNEATGLTSGGPLLLTGAPNSESAFAPGSKQLNAPSTAYVGDGLLLFFGREGRLVETGQDGYGDAVYAHFDVRAGSWQQDEPQSLVWPQAGGSATPTQTVAKRQLHGSPEIVSLRNPDDDRYQAVIFQQTGPANEAVMATGLLDNVSSGEPTLAAGLPILTSLSRAAGGPIYGFRVMFDNGIYYLHYNDGPEVPDWPDRFVLAATLDPYAGPWVASPTTNTADSTYFRRGTELEPDNGAIWQGCMFKHRGRYYLYYENYHSIDDVDSQYENYADPQAGSRVGFATA